jgi:hypothetical protein
VKKSVLVGISILAAVVLLLGSHANVIGYQLVKTSQLQQLRSQRTLLVKSLTNFVEKTTLLKGQNVSLLSLLFFMIGFLFGLITLLPVAVYYLYVTFILMVFLAEFFYGSFTPKIILSFTVKGIILWLALLLDYLLSCGFFFQDKLISFFDGTPFFRMIEKRTL